MGKLFISYRREDTQDITARVYERLAARFGKDAIFMDVDSIPIGSDFRQVLRDAVAASSVALIMIGQQWLTAADEHAQRRLDNPSDFVRIEVEAALAHNIQVVPVLVHGATIPRTVDLPPNINALSYRNGTEVRSDHHFNHDVEQLIARLAPLPIDRVELPTRVDFRELFPQHLSSRNSYDPTKLWDSYTQDVTKLGTRNYSQPQLQPVAPIPIGFQLGGRIQYLDLNNHADRAHGVIVGEAGTGKSVLLQTIVSAFAATHPSDYMNFLLLDSNSGIVFDRFKDLPHTVGYFSHVNSTAQSNRLATMLRAEQDRRGAAIQKRRVDQSLQPLPRLLIVIDQFVEMANSEANAQLIDDLVSVLRLGRELGMHLLVTGQRPEGKLASRVMDLVQYRICLRMSEEDSRTIIGRRDAADLPVSPQGRCYMLHGDNQLDLFQAATVQLRAP